MGDQEKRVAIINTGGDLTMYSGGVGAKEGCCIAGNMRIVLCY